MQGQTSSGITSLFSLWVSARFVLSISCLTPPDSRCKCDLAMWQQEQDEVEILAGTKRAYSSLEGKTCKYWTLGYAPDTEPKDEDEEDDESSSHSDAK